MEISETYRNAILTARPQRTDKGRWSVAVRIQTGHSEEIYYADDNISYILREEAAKECLNLGRNLINRGLI